MESNESNAIPTSAGKSGEKTIPNHVHLSEKTTPPLRNIFKRTSAKGSDSRDITKLASQDKIIPHSSVFAGGNEASGLLRDHPSIQPASNLQNYPIYLYIEYYETGNTTQLINNTYRL